MEFKFNLKKCAENSGLVSDGSVWGISTLHYFSGKRHAYEALVKEYNCAMDMFDDACDFIESNFGCHVIKELSSADRNSGVILHKTVVYQHNEEPNETFSVTLKKLDVFGNKTEQGKDDSNQSELNLPGFYERYDAEELYDRF